MKVANQKTVIISDSHLKLESFMNWLASAVSCDVKSVHFCKFGETEDKVVKYIDFDHADKLERFIAVDANVLAEPLLTPILTGAKKIVFFVTQQSNVDDSCVQKLSIAHRMLLRENPQVFVLFSQGGREHASVLEAKLKMLGISPTYPDLHTNDFRAIWQTVSGDNPSDAKDVKSAVVKVAHVVTAKVNQATGPAAKVIVKATAQQTRQSASHNQSVANAEKKSVETKQLEVAAPNMIPVSVSKSPSMSNLGDLKMANTNDTLAVLMSIDGAMGCFIADYTSGMVLAKAGAGVNLDIAAAGNTEVIKAKMKTMVALGIRESIEDILITLGTQYHIIRPMATKQGLFLYIVLDKAKSNLAMARFKLLDAEKSLTI
jgi:hypothetical protein